MRHEAAPEDSPQEDPTQGQGADPGSGDAEVPSAYAQDEQGAPLEPIFPTAERAVDLNKEAFGLYNKLFGDDPTWQGVLKPDGLESAIAAAQNHWAYGPEEDEDARLITALGKVPWKIAGNQVFGNANKRTAYWLLRHSLDENGLGHISPLDYDDTELADHLIAQDKYGVTPEGMTPEQQGNYLQQQKAEMEQNFINMLLQRHEQDGPDPNYVQQYPEGTYMTNPEDAAIEGLQGLARSANILDPVHDGLDPAVWDDPLAAEPTLRTEHSGFIFETIYNVLEKHGYDGMEKWLSLVFTGSLTTYQYSEESDADISLWVDTAVFPEWSRAEMIAIMVSEIDGTKLPGTTHPLQNFVVDSTRFTKDDLYKPGLRSGYDMNADAWIVPPDRSRVHDVEKEMNEAYTIALENADKMEKLLRYEPDKAVMFWHQVHKRRQRDMIKGKGDYSPSNITYKMLNNRGLFPKIEEVSGEYIAHLT